LKRQTVLSNSKIVFERHGDINWLPLGLFIVNQDGSNLVQLRSSNTAAFPKWSPDGKWIAFCETPQGYEFFASNIFIIKPNGEGIRQLTFHKDGTAVVPSWSPDSKSIFYDLYKDRVNQIFIVDIESLCHKQLTYEGSNGEPVFTPLPDVCVTSQVYGLEDHVYDSGSVAPEAEKDFYDKVAERLYPPEGAA
jgi:Tol biopolymer transport system component